MNVFPLLTRTGIRAKKGLNPVWSVLMMEGAVSRTAGLNAYLRCLPEGAFAMAICPACLKWVRQRAQNEPKNVPKSRRTLKNFAWQLLGRLGVLSMVPF